MDGNANPNTNAIGNELFVYGALYSSFCVETIETNEKKMCAFRAKCNLTAPSSRRPIDCLDDCEHVAARDGFFVEVESTADTCLCVGAHSAFALQPNASVHEIDVAFASVEIDGGTFAQWMWNCDRNTSSHIHLPPISTESIHRQMLVNWIRHRRIPLIR